MRFLVLFPLQLLRHLFRDFRVLADDVLQLLGVGFQVVELGERGVGFDLAVFDVAVDVTGKAMGGGASERVFAALHAAETAGAARRDVEPVALTVRQMGG